MGVPLSKMTGRGSSGKLHETPMEIFFLLLGQIAEMLFTRKQ
jgi:hypothetical protein